MIRFTFDDGSSGYLNDGVLHSELSDEEVRRRKYAFPEKRRFPLTDRSRVMSAIKFFNYAKPDEEKALAKAILKRMRELGIKNVNVGKENRFSKYCNEVRHGDFVIVNPIFSDDRSECLKHYGVLGMKWGVRNEDTRRKYNGAIGGGRHARAAKNIAKDAFNLRKAGYVQEAAAVQKVADKHAMKAKKKIAKKTHKNEVVQTRTKNGETLILKRNRGGVIGKVARRVSPAIKKEASRTYNYDVIVGKKRVGDFQMYKKPTGEMNIVWGSTKKKYRGRGYMQAAVKLGENIARRHGAVKLTAELIGSSPDIHTVAKKAGFVKTGEVRTKDILDSWGGLDLVEKKLK